MYRFTRGVKTLNELLAKAKAGRVIDEADIPPIVSIGVIKKEPSQEAASSQSNEPSIPVAEPESKQPTITRDNVSPQLPPPLIPTPVHIPAPSVPPQLQTGDEVEPEEAVEQTPAPAVVDPEVDARLKEYKRAAVGLKRQGNVAGAIKCLKLSKALEIAMKSANGVNLTDFPSVESLFSTESEPGTQQVEQAPAPPASIVQPTLPTVEAIQGTDNSGASATDAPTLNEADLFGAPPPPKTIMDALEQRLNKYKSEVEKATSTSNSSKARRMGRIVKQYEEAITLFKKGKPVPFDELPTPPGFAPIPVGGSSAAEPAAAPAPKPQISATPLEPSPPSTVQPGTSTPEKKPKTDGPSPGSGKSPGTSGSTISRGGKPATKLTLQEKQLQIITLRQNQFKEAALNAKKRGDLNQAREFLRTAKGFDKLIEVAQAGLPVDMATV